MKFSRLSKLETFIKYINYHVTWPFYTRRGYIYICCVCFEILIDIIKKILKLKLEARYVFNITLLTENIFQLT